MQDIIIDRCIICETGDSETIYQVKDHLVTGEVFKLVACKKCGFRYISDPPPASLAGKYYETEEYIEHSDDASGFTNRIYHHARKWMIYYKEKMISNEKGKKKILDFGTGTGYFLNYMRQKGYEVIGVEISGKALSFGKEKFVLNIHHPSEIFEDDFETSFGYITFWHVLEHVYNIDRVMERMYELLDSRGTMIVALPNFRCVEASIYKAFWNGYDAPRHLWHFDQDQFVTYARKFGFRLRQTTLLPLDPFYNCLISESYRKKQWFLLLMPLIGLYSLILGYFNRKKASSIVYFLEKDHV